MPERELLTEIGKVPVCRPRVHDRWPGAGFTSRILPPYMRRIPSIDALIPALYLRGISTGDFSEALETILGPKAKGLSPTNIVRLKGVRKQEYEQWRMGRWNLFQGAPGRRTDLHPDSDWGDGRWEKGVAGRP